MCIRKLYKVIKHVSHYSAIFWHHLLLLKNTQGSDKIVEQTFAGLNIRGDSGIRYIKRKRKKELTLLMLIFWCVKFGIVFIFCCSWQKEIRRNCEAKVAMDWQSSLSLLNLKWELSNCVWQFIGLTVRTIILFSVTLTHNYFEFTMASGIGKLKLKWYF